jgi:hypothetical protein
VAVRAGIQRGLHCAPHRAAEALLRPRITPLEVVQPWLYRGWDRQNGEEDQKKLANIRAEIIESVPEEMRV